MVIYHALILNKNYNEIIRDHSDAVTNYEKSKGFI